MIFESVDATNKDLLTMEEFGKIVRRGKRQLYQDAKAGKYPFIVKMGGSYKIVKAGLIRYLEQQQAK